MAKQEKPKITTIKLSEDIKKRLDGLKEHDRETYNQVIEKALNIINITIRSPIRGARIFRNIKRRKTGKERVYSSIPKQELEQETEELEEQEKEEQ